MSVNKINEALDHIDDDLVADAVEFKRNKKTGVKWVVMAACLCLVAGTATVMAVTGYGTRLIDLFTGRQLGPGYKESGYDLSVDVEKFDEKKLSQEMRDVGNEIKLQFKNRQPWDNRFAGSWEMECESREQACKFVGLKRIKTSDINWKEGKTTLSALGNAEGKIKYIDIETDYSVDDVSLQFHTYIFTKECDEEDIVVRVRATQDVEFTESYFTTGNKIQCQVLESSAFEKGYMNMTGYIVEDGILYTLATQFPENNSAHAVELLHQWAEMF